MEGIESSINVIVNFLIDKGYAGFDGKSFKLASGTSVKTAKAVLSSLSCSPKSLMSSSNKEVKDAAWELEKETSWEALYEAMRQYVEEKERSHLDLSKEGILTPEEVEESLKNIEVFYNANNHKTVLEGILVVDMVKQAVLKLDPRIALHRLGKKAEDVMNDPSRLVVLEFNPLNAKFFRVGQDAGIDMNFINTCPKAWWLDYNVAPAISPRLYKFFNHLFPEEQSLEFVFDNIHHGLVWRNDTALVLTGARGIGKSIYTNVMASGFPENTTTIVAQSFFEDKFNIEMLDKRLLIGEEISFKSEQSKNTLKRLLNPKVPIEGKGKDSFNVANTTNFIITTNDIHGLGIDTSDRRYSIPSVTTKPLKEIMPEREIDEFVTDYTGEMTERGRNELAAFFHFLKNRKPKYSRTAPFKGRYYHELVINSLSDWKKAILDHLVYGDQNKLKDGVILSSIKDSFDKPIRKKAGVLKEFLDDFRYMGECRIAEVVEIERNGKYSLGILPTPEFLKYLNAERDNLHKRGKLISQGGIKSNSASTGTSVSKVYKDE